jgi:hypothetical protein
MCGWAADTALLRSTMPEFDVVVPCAACPPWLTSCNGSMDTCMKPIVWVHVKVRERAPRMHTFTHDILVGQSSPT